MWSFRYSTDLKKKQHRAPAKQELEVRVRALSLLLPFSPHMGPFTICERESAGTWPRTITGLNQGKPGWRGGEK